MVFGCTTTVSYALAYFLPQILNYSLGFDTGTAQCLIAPPYVFAGFVMYATGWFGDKFHVRGPQVAFNALLCIIGLSIVGFHTDGAVRYFGVFLATAGANANVPCVMSYQANNIRGQWKRAFCSATLVGAGAIGKYHVPQTAVCLTHQADRAAPGGIVGSTVFRSEDAPAYIPGMSTAMGAQVITVILVGALTWDFKRQNAKADRGEKLLELGDKHFRYTV